MPCWRLHVAHLECRTEAKGSAVTDGRGERSAAGLQAPIAHLQPCSRIPTPHSSYSTIRGIFHYPSWTVRVHVAPGPSRAQFGWRGAHCQRYHLADLQPDAELHPKKDVDESITPYFSHRMELRIRRSRCPLPPTHILGLTHPPPLLQAHILPSTP